MTETGWLVLYAFLGVFTALTMPMWVPVLIAMWDDFVDLWKRFLKGVS